MRWILLLLYVGLIACLFGIGMWPHGDWFPVILLAITVAALAVFILGAGRKDLCRPIRRPRRLFPLAAAAFMATVLLVGLTWALSETFRIENGGSDEVWIWVLLAAGWVFWGVVLFVYTRGLNRYQTIFGLTRLVFVGSLAELLATVPAHIFVTKRGGCFAGLATSLGILAGLFVMMWSFGPAIFLLFLQEARRQEEREAPSAARTPLLPPRHFQYGLRTLLLLMLATGVISGCLRAFWGRWPAATFGGAVTLVLLTLLLQTRPRLLAATWCVVCAGLVWASWGDWSFLTISVLPLGLYAILLVKVFGRSATTTTGAGK